MIMIFRLPYPYAGSSWDALVPMHDSICDEAQSDNYDWVGAPATESLFDKSELQGPVPVKSVRITKQMGDPWYDRR